MRIMVRKGDFTNKTKKAAIQRQGGLCAFCGVQVQTPWSRGEYSGNAHHLKPLHHGGDDTLKNCVYLCWGDHQLLGHGMAPFGIDEQGGNSSSWVQLEQEDFKFWNGPHESRKKSAFFANVKRGRDFEGKEKKEWNNLQDGSAEFEVGTKWKGKNGRIDIRVDELGGFVSVIELKATDWDKILSHRIRVTALRHARQLWRYVEKEIEEGLDVCPGIIYSNQPSDSALEERITDILNNRFIQVVWRNQSMGESSE